MKWFKCPIVLLVAVALELAPFALLRAGKDKSSAEPESHPESLMHPPSSESSDGEMQGGDDAVDEADDEPPYDEDISLLRFLSIGQLVLQLLFSPLATVVIMGEVFRTVLVATAFDEEDVLVLVAVTMLLLLFPLELEFISLGDGKVQGGGEEESGEEGTGDADVESDDEFNTVASDLATLQFDFIFDSVQLELVDV